MVCSILCSRRQVVKDAFALPAELLPHKNLEQPGFEPGTHVVPSAFAAQQTARTCGDNRWRNVRSPIKLPRDFARPGFEPGPRGFQPSSSSCIRRRPFHAGDKRWRERSSRERSLPWTMYSHRQSPAQTQAIADASQRTNLRPELRRSLPVGVPIRSHQTCRSRCSTGDGVRLTTNCS